MHNFGIDLENMQAKHFSQWTDSEKIYDFHGSIIVTKYTDGVIVKDNTVTGHNLDEDGADIFFYH